ncbi:hypothetical protein Taro_044429 [Colocasia esculenta]|uniref:Uncharacterized protein n=1 Tax=Colocasia esculenta TaxID=4460 RepID=A0A843X0T1_COLES|nr:hypothetical protein [Colocasia esculenta]
MHCLQTGLLGQSSSVDTQERFVAVKIKIYGNKAVDIADLEKNGMHSVVAAIQRMKWMKMVTVSEASYPDLVKPFFTCLKVEEDGSLTSTVKGTPIHITYDLLESLFGVSTVGCSRVDSVDIQAKGLGIIGTDYKLKDGKIDINQLNAFNRILHFIIPDVVFLPKLHSMVLDSEVSAIIFERFARVMGRISV